MTGLQALERAAPSQPDRDEYEYVRYGNTSLIVSLGPTRREGDFVSHIDPSGEWVFVVNNLNIHLSEQLVSFVINVCGRNISPEELGKKVAAASCGT